MLGTAKGLDYLIERTFQLNSLRPTYRAWVSYRGSSLLKAFIRTMIWAKMEVLEEPTGKGKTMPDDRSVKDMVDEVLARQAAYRASETGESFKDALQTVLGTAAGRQLQELRSSPHGDARADEWQTIVARERAQKRFAR